MARKKNELTQCEANELSPQALKCADGEMLLKNTNKPLRYIIHGTVNAMQQTFQHINEPAQ